MKRDPSLDRVGSGLYRLGRLLSSRRVSSSMADAAGAPLSQQALQLLRALRDGTERPVAEAARAARMDVGAASRQLRKLDDAGLTSRASSPENASVVLVKLTEAGLELARRLQEVNNAHLRTALAGWNDEDRAKLGDLLLRLVEDLQKTPYQRAD